MKNLNRIYDFSLFNDKEKEGIQVNLRIENFFRIGMEEDEREKMNEAFENDLKKLLLKHFKDYDKIEKTAIYRKNRRMQRSNASL